MAPQDFLLDVFSRTIPYPFQSENLGSADLGNLLRLAPNDLDSLPKFRASAISMVLFLTFRGVAESFVTQYSEGFGTMDRLIPYLKKAANLFDAIAESQRQTAGLPAYVTETYFPRWWNRYYQAAQHPDRLALRHATLQTFFMQCTFSYESEPAVATSENAIIEQGEVVFDDYVIGLRNFLGQEFLH